MKSIFRDKSMDRISTPEQLNSFVEVSGKCSWAVLLAVIVFIAGALIWSFTGQVHTKVDFGAVVSDGVLTGYIKEQDRHSFDKGSEIYIDEEKYTVASIASQPVMLPENTEEFVRYIGNLEPNVWVYEFKAECGLPDGIYRACAVTETVRPIELVLD